MCCAAAVVVNCSKQQRGIFIGFEFSKNRVISFTSVSIQLLTRTGGLTGPMNCFYTKVDCFFFPSIDVNESVASGDG